MADNSERIAELEAILEGGETSISVDGVSVQYDQNQVRQELQRLRATDTASQLRRPRLSTVNLSGLR